MVKTQGREPYRGTDTRARPYYWDMESPIQKTFPVWDITSDTKPENEDLDINSIRGDGVLTEEDGEWYEVRSRGMNLENWINLKTGLLEVRAAKPKEKPGPSSEQSRQRTYQDPYHFWRAAHTPPPSNPFGHTGFDFGAGTTWETTVNTSEWDEATKRMFFGDWEKPPEPKPKRQTKRPKGKPTEQEARDQAKADRDRLKNMRPKTSPSPETPTPTDDGPPVTKTTRVMYRDSNGVWRDLPVSTDGFS